MRNWPETLMVTLLLVCSSALADDTHPVKNPQPATNPQPETNSQPLADSSAAHNNAVPWQKLTLVGEGTLSVWFWDVYHAQLYSDNGRYQPEQFPLALKLTYLRDFSKDDLVSETAKQWQKLGFTRSERQQQWLSTLRTQWRDVTENDSITLFIDQQQTSWFYFNNEVLGQVTDPAFTQAFLAIWLSKDTSAPDVRKKLIAGKS